MPRPILNVDALEYRPWGHGERFEARVGDIAAKIGAQKLGYNVTVVPPGKRAYPAHCHRVNEEMFFVLEGQGELRVGSERYPVRAGDIIACPPGGPETAHQIINDSNAELGYISVSTMMPAEVCEYPDSKKVGAYGGGLRHMTRTDHHVDYWTDEI
jgi:uncharacterized cupin superfamily protein